MCEHKDLQNEIKSMNELFKEFREETKEERKQFTNKLVSIETKLTDFILEAKTTYISSKDAKEKFASKLAEKIIYGFVSLCLVGLVSALLNSVMK